MIQGPNLERLLSRSKFESRKIEGKIASAAVIV